MCYSRSPGGVLERGPRLPRPPILAAAIPGQKHTGQSAGEMKISTAKKQMMQSIARQFPCNACFTIRARRRRRPAALRSADIM
jgi:hypothetical protein